jgi:hypothetical protein
MFDTKYCDVNIGIMVAVLLYVLLCISWIPGLNSDIYHGVLYV